MNTTKKNRSGIPASIFRDRFDRPRNFQSAHTLPEGIADAVHQRFVVACDEIYTTKELVKNDIIDFVICQSPTVQGYQAIKKLHDYLNKIGSAPEDFIVDTVIKVKTHFE